MISINTTLTFLQRPFLSILAIVTFLFLKQERQNWRKLLNLVTMAFEGKRQDSEEVWGRGFDLRANRSAVSLLKTRVRSNMADEIA